MPEKKRGSSSEPNPDVLLGLYDILFTKFNQEGDGYWSRFNIIAGIELALLAAAGGMWAAAG